MKISKYINLIEDDGFSKKDYNSKINKFDRTKNAKMK